jgi:pimeloyl-ACP methyl ester carboxylesterase
MQTIEMAGVSLEVKLIEGPDARSPLVFLHEGLGSISMWTQRGHDWPTELCAATGRSGFVYSRRGYGHSDPVDNVRGPTVAEGFWRSGRHAPDYMHHEAWEVLPALMQRAGRHLPVLVGHSDGATMALLHASRFPVTACIAMAPHVTVEDITIRSIQQARQMFTSDPSPQGLRQRLSRHHQDVDNAFWQWNDVWLSDAFQHFDIRAECAHITAPLLLVQGVDDEYGSLQQLQWIQDAAPHAHKLALDACGHSPHRDQPARLTAAVREFLSDLP